MRTKSDIVPDSWTYFEVIEACVRSRQVSTCSHPFAAPRRLCHEPPERGVTCKALTSSLTGVLSYSLLQIMRALELLRLANAAGLAMDVPMHMMVARGAALLGQYRTVASFLKQMEDRGVALDDEAYAVLMAAHSKAGDVEGALRCE